MISMPYTITLRILSILTCFILGGTWLSTPAHAELPPRPPVPEKDAEQESRPIVASILLQATPARDGLVSVVQWQDDQGGWHDIESWRGAVNNGQTIWWVEEKDFGKGPYRWQVFDQAGETLLGTSALFDFPTEAKAQLVIEVLLTRQSLSGKVTGLSNFFK